MKQFIVDRHTAPSTPTLDEVPTEKIPIYNSLDDAENDLANLEEGQLIATKDDGADELLKTVDTVEDNNMHPVTSNAVAESISYFTTEQATGGKWIDGKPIYRKVIDFGALPNNTTKSVAHNITNLDKIVNLVGYAVSGTVTLVIPFVSLTNLASCISNAVNGDNLTVTTGTDRSSFTAKVIIEYTKTTD